MLALVSLSLVSVKLEVQLFGSKAYHHSVSFVLPPALSRTLQATSAAMPSVTPALCLATARDDVLTSLHNAVVQSIELQVSADDLRGVAEQAVITARRRAEALQESLMAPNPHAPHHGVINVSPSGWQCVCKQWCPAGASECRGNPCRGNLFRETAAAQHEAELLSAIAQELLEVDHHMNVAAQPPAQAARPAAAPLQPAVPAPAAAVVKAVPKGPPPAYLRQQAEEAAALAQRQTPAA